MKNLSLLWVLVLLSGCAYGAQQVKTMVTDPSSKTHQESLDELESRYLKGDISYSQYQDMKQEELNRYDSEVQKREATLNSP